MNAEAAPFRLLVITPEGTYRQEISWVNRLFENGLQTLHLRKPGWTREQLSLYLEALDKALHTRVMVHHEASLLKDFGLKGVHGHLAALPQDKADYMVSCPVHSWQEFMSVEKRVNYALVSPFFNSISKKGYAANEQLHELPLKAGLQKAVALGGITERNIQVLRQKGLGGAALLGAIWQGSDPLTAFLQICNQIKDAR